MLPTPDITHVDFSNIYAPAEDTYLVLDTLSSASEVKFLRSRFSRHPLPLAVEVGTGSGSILAFVAANAQALLGRSDVLALGTDVNAFACSAAAKTVRQHSATTLRQAREAADAADAAKTKALQTSSTHSPNGSHTEKPGDEPSTSPGSASVPSPSTSLASITPVSSVHSGLSQFNAATFKLPSPPALLPTLHNTAASIHAPSSIPTMHSPLSPHPPSHAPPTPATFLSVLHADLLTPLLPHSVDLLLFNPPYVPSEALPRTPPALVPDKSDLFSRDMNLLALATDGGADGMEVTRKLLRQLPSLLRRGRGVAYVLLCKRNRPDEVVEWVRSWGPNGEETDVKTNGAERRNGGGAETRNGVKNGGANGVARAKESWDARIVGESGAKGGWERLCVVRVCSNG